MRKDTYQIKTEKKTLMRLSLFTLHIKLLSIPNSTLIDYMRKKYKLQKKDRYYIVFNTPNKICSKKETFLDNTQINNTLLEQWQITVTVEIKRNN